MHCRQRCDGVGLGRAVRRLREQPTLWRLIAVNAAHRAGRRGRRHRPDAALRRVADLGPRRPRSSPRGASWSRRRTTRSCATPSGRSRELSARHGRHPQGRARVPSLGVADGRAQPARRRARGQPRCSTVSTASRARTLRRSSSRSKNERRRIGRELHDETSQSLAAALLNLDLAEKGLDGVASSAVERIDSATAPHPALPRPGQAAGPRPAPVDARRLRARAGAALVRPVAPQGRRARGRDRLAERRTGACRATSRPRCIESPRSRSATSPGTRARPGPRRRSRSSPATPPCAISDNGQGFEPARRDPRQGGPLRRRAAVDQGARRAARRHGAHHVGARQGHAGPRRRAAAGATAPRR